MFNACFQYSLLFRIYNQNRWRNNLLSYLVYYFFSLFYLFQWQLYSGPTSGNVQLVFAFVGEFPLDIMVEVSGGKLLSQKSQAPVPLSSFIQAFVVDEMSHRGFINGMYCVNMRWHWVRSQVFVKDWGVELEWIKILLSSLAKMRR